MNSFKRKSDRDVSRESSVKRPRETLDVLEPNVYLEGPGGFEKPSHKPQRSHRLESRSSNSPSQGAEDHDSTTEEVSNQLAPISLPIKTKSSVCFGMIHNANTKIIQAGFPSGGGLDDGPFIPKLDQLNLSFKEQAVFVGPSSEPDIAIMNEETSKVLRDLSSFDSCRFQVFVGDGSCIMSSGAEKTLNKDRFMPVDIVIYGLQEIQKSVGGLLSSARIYLQHPYHQDSGTEYDNPHFLNLAELSTAFNLPHSISRNHTPLKQLETSDISPDEPRDNNPMGEALQTKLTKVFGLLKRYKTLKRLEADIRIASPLLQHQEEALDFMAQRELGPIQAEFSLWSKHERGSQTYYEHNITGARTADLPVETLGGILADDMGLGKTLTVLSTILRTAHMSKCHAEGTSEGTRTLEANENSTNQILSRATLVIVPSSLLIDGWLEEIKRHCNGSLGINVYHGRSREVDPSSLADWDLVLTTYHTVAAEARQSQGLLNQIIWFRIVLDEAHIIRRMTTKLFQAVSRIPSKFRWCLTGTPIQNKLEDLASLVAFIQLSPLHTLTEFRKHIITPLLKERDQGLNNLRVLLDSICLRRTKGLLNLPDVFDEDRRIDFTLAEEVFYNETQANMIAKVKEHDGRGQNSKDFFGIFQLQLQLRRLCNHGTFPKSLSRFPIEDIQFDPEQAFELLREKGMTQCAYCNLVIEGINEIEDEQSGSFTVCGHLLCAECAPKYKVELRDIPGTGYQCSLCMRKVPENFIAGSSLDIEENRSNLPPTLFPFDDNSISSKVNALINDLIINTNEGKSIVFSCWTRSLDLVAQHLSVRQMNYARIDGTYSLRQRQKILGDYHSDMNTSILLMTTGTGAVGLEIPPSELDSSELTPLDRLNLTIANYVYILEPQWNPMVESQAISRVSRLNQTRNVHVIRYIVNGTVEEGMRSQQAKKLGFAKLGWKENE